MTANDSGELELKSPRLGAVALAVLLHMDPVSADPLPYADGHYATDPAICEMDAETINKVYGDAIGSELRVIKGRSLTNGYEMSCDVSNVRFAGSDLLFDAKCEQEGEVDMIKGRYRVVDSKAFSIDGSVFRLCSSIPPEDHVDQFDTSTESIVELYYAADRKCRGGAGNDPRTTGACGEREEYSNILSGRDWCFGREGEAGYQMAWHVCGPGSMRD